MLDVHPAHHAASTWKDFFIHIATIVIGLLIAVGLEQTVEAFHHYHQRHQLREDLHSETEQRIALLQANEKSNANDIAWYRAILRAGREAPVSGGMVTLTLPAKTRMPYITDTPDGIWPAAKASGAATVLTREEIELWDGMERLNDIAGKSFDAREDALKLVFGVGERIGIRPAAGETMHLSVSDRDELMRDYAQLLEATWQLERNETYAEGACQGILHGGKTVDELLPYQNRAIAAMPK